MGIASVDFVSGVWGTGVVLWGLILLVPKVRIILLPILESILLFLSILNFVIHGVRSFIMIPAVLAIGGVLFWLYCSGRSKNYDNRFSNGDNIYVWGVWAIWFFGICLFFIVLPSFAPVLWYRSEVWAYQFHPYGPFLSYAALLTLRIIWYVYKETAKRQRNLLPLGGLSIGLILTHGTIVVYADDTLQLRLTNSCYQCDLSGADLSYRDLTGADLRGANLAGANLTGARLDGASFYYSIDGNRPRNTSLKGANLTRASLAGADFYSANLNGANFTGADLREANFTAASESNANFTDANLRLAKGDPAHGGNNSVRYCNTTMHNGSVNNSDCPK